MVFPYHNPAVNHAYYRPPPQLLALTALPKLTSLSVSPDDNPVVSHAHFRSLAIVALPALRTLNSAPVTAEEKASARERGRASAPKLIDHASN